MSDLYQQLLAEVAKREADLEKARAEFERSQEAARKAAEALRIAASHLRPSSVSAAPTSVPAPMPTTRPPLEPPLPVVSSTPTFIDIVAKTIEGMDSEVTTSLVFDRLSAAGVPLGDNPRTKISTALTRLEERGALVKTFEGSIGRPHVYGKPAK